MFKNFKIENNKQSGIGQSNHHNDLIVRTDNFPVKQYRLQPSKLKDTRHKLLEVMQSVDINFIYKDIAKDKLSKSILLASTKIKPRKQLSPGRFYHRPDSRTSPLRNENDSSMNVRGFKSEKIKKENLSTSKIGTNRRMASNNSNVNSVAHENWNHLDESRPGSAANFPLITVCSKGESNLHWLFDQAKAANHCRTQSEPVDIILKETLEKTAKSKKIEKIKVKIKNKSSRMAFNRENS
ncbi:unnamed protein product [Blepharisma stoltei]|uniref:Uncharacterized protein n=1 Tax=Blepharisma stoltei TaxID=1481888 RepID=A0AAU9KB57_9CILI|nr:unnamed protein product [Blepharisma stoltei]